MDNNGETYFLASIVLVGKGPELKTEAGKVNFHKYYFRNLHWIPAQIWLMAKVSTNTNNHENK